MHLDLLVDEAHSTFTDRIYFGGRQAGWLYMLAADVWM
jgi:hypothetical protein